MINHHEENEKGISELFKAEMNHHLQHPQKLVQDL